jgi:hypothetical protein
MIAVLSNADMPSQIWLKSAEKNLQVRKKWGWYADFCIAAQPRYPQTSACPSFTGAQHQSPALTAN